MRATTPLQCGHHVKRDGLHVVVFLLHDSDIEVEADARLPETQFELRDDIDHEVVGQVADASGHVDFDVGTEECREIEGGCHARREFHVAVFAGYALQCAGTQFVEVCEVFRDKLLVAVGEYHGGAVVAVEAEVSVEFQEVILVDEVAPADIERDDDLVELVEALHVHLAADVPFPRKRHGDVCREENVRAVVVDCADADSPAGRGARVGPEGVADIPHAVDCERVCAQYCDEHG